MLYSFIIESDNFYIWIGKLFFLLVVVMIMGYFFIGGLVKIFKKR